MKNTIKVLGNLTRARSAKVPLVNLNRDRRSKVPLVNLTRARSAKVPLVIIAFVAIVGFSVAGCKTEEEPEKKFVAVTGITGLPTTATVGTAFTLAGTVEPDNATNKAITWYDIDSRTSILADQTPNIVATWKLRATIKNGKAEGTDYTQDFTITVSPGAAATNWVAPTSGVDALTAGTWKKVDNTGGYSTDWEKNWYSFSAESGQTYWIWWDDAGAYVDTDKAGDIVVSGYYADGKVIFSQIDKAWGNTVYFTASEAGTVYLLAEPYGASKKEDYAICYHTLATKPSGWNKN